MSATIRRVEFSVTVEDPEHWTPEHRAAADAEPAGSYDDWVYVRLEVVMREAGERFIADHPDLFRYGELI